MACSSDDESDGYTLRIGATSPTGTPAGSLGWGDKQGILAEQLKAAGVDKIEYAFFQSGSDVASALFAGAVDVAAIGDNPALRARGKDPKVVLLTLDSINGDAGWSAPRAVRPTSRSWSANRHRAAGHDPRPGRQAAHRRGGPDRQDPGARRTDARIDRRTELGPDRRHRRHRRQRHRAGEKGFPIIDSLSRHGLGSTGTNIALSTFTEEHPEFADAWRQAVTAVNKDIQENFDQYPSGWRRPTAPTSRTSRSRPGPTSSTPTRSPQGVDQLQAAYDFLKADGSLEGQYSVREWVGAQS